MILPGCTAVAALGLFIAAAVIDPCAAQPIVIAPGGVAVGGSIENSQISIINKTVNNQDPAVLTALTKTFTDQTAANAEAKAEAKAAELAQNWGSPRVLSPSSSKSWASRMWRKRKFRRG
jgi:hypothetical protein